MMYEDITTEGTSFAKDPCAVHFKGRYHLFYSTHDPEKDTYGIGHAVSPDLTHFTKIGELKSESAAEGRGICAPAAIVLNDRIHLFYQSYGQFPKDYICHAWSDDGEVFTRDPSNPVFKPSGDWNCGRAIDADVVVFNGRLLLYWATRDPDMKVQQLGVAAAKLDSGFSHGAWEQLDPDAPVLKPVLPWERDCIEAPAACVYGGRVYLFYAGAYNCAPQQIGCAVSDDGVHFTRLFNEPMLTNGRPGSWNECESGHPYIFPDGDRFHLFYQGSDDMGRTWRLSRAEIRFGADGKPEVV